MTGQVTIDRCRMLGLLAHMSWDTTNGSIVFFLPDKVGARLYEICLSLMTAWYPLYAWL
jgi:hypothetical protein